ncbi:uncharacterized protein LOC131825511 [Mustela lutreola]|uniref:uncharacterized protein LOC131825511 n=1 Tax=Mustela lutreola TaxID=9666 RepID=UPI0027971DC8|nr:uncharacterized protein LOC131825511 [Mustela lutreola]
MGKNMQENDPSRFPHNQPKLENQSCVHVSGRLGIPERPFREEQRNKAWLPVVLATWPPGAVQTVASFQANHCLALRLLALTSKGSLKNSSDWPPPPCLGRDFPHSAFQSCGTSPEGAHLLPVQLSRLPFTWALKLHRREPLINLALHSLCLVLCLSRRKNLTFGAETREEIEPPPQWGGSLLSLAGLDLPFRTPLLKPWLDRGIPYGSRNSRCSGYNTHRAHHPEVWIAPDPPVRQRTCLHLQCNPAGSGEPQHNLETSHPIPPTVIGVAYKNLPEYPSINSSSSPTLACPLPTTLMTTPPVSRK